MSPTVRCPQCGKDFPPGLEPQEYEGICPGCLAFMAMDTQDTPVLSSPGVEPPPPPPEPPPLKRGATFRGLEVLELIGQGGMGVVYKARQIELDRVVALKVLSPRLASDEEFSRRFHREAKALASLDHPHIVRVHDVGREAGLYFLIMEHVDGINLRDILVQKKLPPEQALRIVPQLCDALEYAHSKGVIHRDIKPENILLDRAGGAKIADFGLAKIVKDEKASFTITQTNLIMGTAEYMAPEQREGLKEVDHRADIYSMGVVLYELLTGELPVGRFDLPSRRARLDVRIDDVVLKALEKNPELRYQRASHMGTDVNQVLAAGPSPQADCPIVDLSTGQRVGTAASRRFAVRTVACPLKVAGWAKDEIAYRIAGDYQLDAASSTPLLQSQIETGEIELFVPRGVDLDVVAAEGAVSVSSVVGQVQAKLPDGDLAVARHDGSLRVHAAAGKVTIDGLRSEYFEVRTRTGEVALRGLELSRGRGQVETEGGRVRVAAAGSSSFRYYLQTGSGKVDGPSVGQVGAGAASLTVRTASGDISLVPPVAAEGLKDFLRHLTPKQVEQVGVYLIVNAAFFIFFVLVAGTAIPAVCIAVFWGMGLALDIWTKYVRRTNLDGARISETLPAKIQEWATRTFAKPPAAAAAAPPSPPPAARPRVSFLAVLAVLAGVTGALAGGGAGVATLVETVELSTSEANVARLVVFVLGIVGAFFSLMALVLGVVVSAHVDEARGLLRGKAGARVALFLALIGLWVVFGYARPRLLEVRLAASEARRVTQEFVDHLRSRRFAEARDLMSDELRARWTVEDLQSRVEGGMGRYPDRWRALRLDGVKLSGDRRTCDVGYLNANYGREWFGLSRQGRWRLERVNNFFRQFGN